MHGSRDQDHQTDVDTRTAYFKSRRGILAGLKKVLPVAASSLALAAFSAFAPSSLAQKPSGAVKAQVVTGLTGVKDKTSGNLSVEGGSLHFSHEQTKVDVAAASMEDVVTGADSQRVIHGSVGSTVLLAAPYGSGRFLSLFRTKLETLTIKYRDSDGGLHGAIFMMPVGKVEEIKKELLAQGAHTSIPPEQAASAAPAAKEQKQ